MENYENSTTGNKDKGKTVEQFSQETRTASPHHDALRRQIEQQLEQQLEQQMREWAAQQSRMDAQHARPGEPSSSLPARDHFQPDTFRSSFPSQPAFPPDIVNPYDLSWRPHSYETTGYPDASVSPGNLDVLRETSLQRAPSLALAPPFKRQRFEPGLPGGEARRPDQEEIAPLLPTPLTGITILPEQLATHTLQNVSYEKRLLNFAIHHNRKKSAEKRVDEKMLQALVSNAQRDFDQLLRLTRDRADETWNHLVQMKRNAKSFKDQTGLDTYHSALKALTFTEASSRLTGKTILPEQLATHTLQSVRKEKQLFYSAIRYNREKGEEKRVDEATLQALVTSAHGDFDHLLRLSRYQEDSLGTWNHLVQMKENANSFKKQTGLDTYHTALEALTFTDAPFRLTGTTILPEQLATHTLQNVTDEKSLFNKIISSNRQKTEKQIPEAMLQGLTTSARRDFDTLLRLSRDRGDSLGTWNHLDQMNRNADFFKDKTGLDTYHTALNALTFIDAPFRLTGKTILPEQLDMHTLKSVNNEKQLFNKAIDHNGKKSAEKRVDEEKLQGLTTDAKRDFDTLLRLSRDRGDSQMTWDHLAQMNHNAYVFEEQTGLDVYHSALNALTFIDAPFKITGKTISPEQLATHTLQNVFKEKQLFNTAIHHNSKKSAEKRVDEEKLQGLTTDAKRDFDTLRRLSQDQGNSQRTWDHLVQMNLNAGFFKEQTGLDTYHSALNALTFTDASFRLTGTTILPEQLATHTLQNVSKEKRLFSAAISNNSRERGEKQLPEATLQALVTSAKRDFDTLRRLSQDQGNSQRTWDHLAKMKEYANSFKHQTDLDIYHNALNALTFTKAPFKITGTTISSDQLATHTLQNVTHEKSLFDKVIRSNREKSAEKQLPEATLQALVTSAKGDFDTLLRLSQDQENSQGTWGHLVKMKEYANSFKEQTGLDTYHTALKTLAFTEASFRLTGKTISSDQLVTHTLKNVSYEKQLFNTAIYHNREKSAEKQLPEATLQEPVTSAKRDFDRLLRLIRDQADSRMTWDHLVQMNLNADAFEEQTGLNTYHTALNALTFIERGEELP